MQLLASHRVLSAPLMVFPTLRPSLGEGLADDEPGTERPMYLGFLDVLDLLGGLLANLPPWVGVSPAVWRGALAEAAPRFMARRLVTLPSRHDGDCVWSARAAAPLLDVLRGGFMASPGRATHRVAVFDDHGDITAVVSQSDVVRFLAANADEMLAGWLGDASLQQLRLGGARGALACAGAGAPAVEALAAMRRLDVSALAVLSDDDGELVGNLSASDLRGVVAASLEALAEPVQPLLRRLHQSSVEGVGVHPFFQRAAAHAMAEGGQAKRRRRSRTPSPERSPRDAPRRRLEAEKSPPPSVQAPPLLTATAATPFRQAVARLAAAGVHRVYVADERGRPSGVVTLTDVLRAVMDHAEASGQGQA